MTSIQEIRDERMKKLNILVEKGYDPYPSTSARTHMVADAVSSFDALAESGEEVTLAGRIMVVRGKVLFCLLIFSTIVVVFRLCSRRTRWTKRSLICSKKLSTTVIL